MKGQPLDEYPLILALVAVVGGSKMANKKNGVEPMPNVEEEIVGGHRTAHAAAHGMTEEDLVGGNL